MTSRWAEHHARVDDQKWNAALAYVRAYNEWKVALVKYGDAFHPIVTQLWDILMLRHKDFKRMAKK